MSAALVPHVAGPGVTMACGSEHHGECCGWLLPNSRYVVAVECACACPHPSRKRPAELRYEATWFNGAHLPTSRPFQR